jgi:transcriptional regulator with XRE-family HTH domain
MNKEKTGCGKIIKELRLEAGLTMDMFVEDINQRYLVNFDKGRVSRWENGVNDPDLNSARYIAEYFNVSLDYLIGLTDVKTPARLLAYSKKLSNMKMDTQ